MPGSYFALLDDFAAIAKQAASQADGVAASAKVATTKAMSIVVDDVGAGAASVFAIKPERELPVVAKIAKISLKNKRTLIPIALTLSAFAPGLIPVMLLAGGKYIEFEAFEKT